MKHLILMSAIVFAAVLARAEELIVLNPGSGLKYMANWCGGQSVNEYANGFDVNGNPTAVVVVGTSCHGSGRGSKNHYYRSCSISTFDLDGTLLSIQKIGQVSWLQGGTAPSCGITYGAGTAYEDDLSNLLYTDYISGYARAILSKP